jgi:hypothetical protein
VYLKRQENSSLVIALSILYIKDFYNAPPDGGLRILARMGLNRWGGSGSYPVRLSSNLLVMLLVISSTRSKTEVF